MKLKDILIPFTLSIMAKGAWLAAIVQPVIISIGAILSSIDLDVLEFGPINLLKSEKDKKPDKSSKDYWDNDSDPIVVP